MNVALDVLSVFPVRPLQAVLRELPGLQCFWMHSVSKPGLLLSLPWSHSVIVMRTWGSTQKIVGYQRVCGVSLKPGDGPLLSTFRKGTMMIKKYPFDWLERPWFFKVDFNIRMCTFITGSTARQKRASVQRKDFCLFGSFWHHIFEVDNQRGKNQFHKTLFEVNNFSLYMSVVWLVTFCVKLF